MIPTPIQNYVQQGLSLLTSQFQQGQAPQLQALLAAYLGEAQVLEDAVNAVVTYRQRANLLIYSPLSGTFEVTNGIQNVTVTGTPAVSQTNYIFPGAVLTFSNYPGTSYTVLSIDSTGLNIVLSTDFGGPSNAAVTATQALTNANMDVVGNLIGQLRLGQNDLNYLSVITLRIAINRSIGTVVNWSNFAAILLRTSGGPVSYYEGGDAQFFFGVWDMTLNPAIVAQILSSAVPNGVGPNIFAYTIWPDGNDFVWSSTYDGSAGEGVFSSVYDTSIGGLLVAAFPM